MITTETKRCTGCGEIKTTAEFSRDAQKKDGLNGWCKACYVARRRKWQGERLDWLPQYPQKLLGSGEFAFVLGALIADGTVDLSYISISSADNTFIGAVRDALETCGFLTRLYTYPNEYGTLMYHVYVNSRATARLMYPLKYCEGAFEPFLQRHPTQFIRGFFSGDGSLFTDAGVVKASMSNNRRDILESIRSYMLSTMGLHPTNLHHSGRSYQFLLNRPTEVMKFLEVICPYKPCLYSSS